MKNFPSLADSVRDRLLHILWFEVPEKGRYGWLETHTGIARTTWQNFFTRSNATPSGDMIQAVARLYPRYAFWLASGLTDQEFGHTYPRSAMAKCYPELLYESRKRFDDYFQHCMDMQMAKYDSNTAIYAMQENIDAQRKLEHLARLREIEIAALREEEKKERAKHLLRAQKEWNVNEFRIEVRKLPNGLFQWAILKNDTVVEIDKTEGMDTAEKAREAATSYIVDHSAGWGPGEFL